MKKQKKKAKVSKKKTTVNKKKAPEKPKEKKISKVQMEKYQAMSPFELKNVLIKMAQEACSRSENKKDRVLNAGRGNPNFLNTTAREAFSILNLFACELAKKQTSTSDLGLRPIKKDIAKKLKLFLKSRKSSPAVNFLKNSIDFAETEFLLTPNDLVYELTDAILGDFYPSPPRIFPNTETIVNAYLKEVHCPEGLGAKGDFDLFACEGATAAMVYIFNSLKENRILKAGDHIAIITPIFSPYLEIPALKDYQLVQVHIKQSENLGWQIPDTELEKLKDRRIKALFMVHPTNPTSIKLKKETLQKIAKLIRTQRKELIILTDTVYATFVDDFHSLVEVIPENTICVYSYSKFFGVTGWRLGVIMLHQNHIIDKLIAGLSKRDTAALDTRYKMDSATPEKIKFIDRLEMDSRDVALAHTGGLSCPQQCLMCLLSLFYLMDQRQVYKKSIQSILKKRIKLLYDNLDLGLYTGPDHTYYYTLIDLERMARIKHGDAFADHLQTKLSVIEFLFRLAKEKYSICLPGEGFAGPKWSIRLSLANLNDDAYKLIGRNISSIMNDYYHHWAKKKSKR